MNDTMKLERIFESMLRNREQYVETILSRPESLSDLLPYDEYLPKHGVFVMKDGSLGAVFEVELAEHEPLRESQVKEMVKSFKPWFSLSEHYALQLLYDQSEYSPLDQGLTSIAGSYPDAHPVSKQLFEKKMKAVKEHCKSTASFGGLLQRKLFLSIRYFPKTSQSFWKKVFGTSSSPIEVETTKFLTDLREFKHTLANLEDSAETALHRVDADGLLDILRRFFNPKTYFERGFAQYNPSVPLSKQFIFSSPVLDHHSIEREGVSTRTLSLKTSPLYSYAGGMAYFCKLGFPFKLSMSVSFPTKTKVKRFFDLKEFFLQNTPTARAKVQREEVLAVQDKLARDDRCLQMTFNVIVEGSSAAEISERTRRIASIFHNELECEIIEETL